MMTPEQFEQKLRELLQQKPYKPVRVVLLGGDVFEIDDPQYVARDGGAAGYIDAQQEVHLFDYRDVEEFTVASSGVAT